MTIGNEDISLSDVIIETLKEMGHEYEDYGSERKTQHSYAPEKLNFKVSGYDWSTYVYQVEVNRGKNTAKLSIGIFPEFDFHKPDSIVLFKAAIMLIPTMLVLRDVSDLINKLVTPKGHY